MSIYDIVCHLATLKETNDILSAVAKLTEEEARLALVFVLKAYQNELALGKSTRSHARELEEQLQEAYERIKELEQNLQDLG